MVAVGIVSSWHRGVLDRRSWIVVIALQLLLVCGSVAALRSGASDQEFVRHVVAEQHIQTHERAARLFVWVSGSLLVLMAFVPLIRQEPAALAIAAAASAATFLVAGLGYRVGDAGGDLVYRHGGARAFASPGALEGPRDSSREP